ncbi:hypothetical protein SCUCBS95973_005537 [Sporothrix curviconia]|uniref:F-box domain-containing protein n=1 Tax=Sporothrix curviconia TaxID=1260050 RepID=A0ABP0BXN1_9PEZI
MPTEILHKILTHVDVPTIICMRRTSRRIWAAVESLMPYRIIRKHCSDVLRAVICLDARGYSLATLFATLQTSTCAGCACLYLDPVSPWMGQRVYRKPLPGCRPAQRLATYLYLITCERLCHDCFSGNVYYYPMSLDEVTRGAALPLSTVLAERETYPSIRTLPGKYSPDGIPLGERMVLVDRSAVRRAVGCHPKLPPPRQETEPPPLRGLATCSLPCRYSMDEYTWRNAVTVTVPYLNLHRSANYVDWGYYCAPCDARSSGVTAYRMHLTRDGFLQHLELYHGVTKASEQAVAESQGALEIASASVHLGP